MTVRENMAFSMRLAKAPAAVIASETDRASRILGLDALLDRYPRQLSGGQRQRVAMGRAIVRHPQVFLFDEPLSNLDAKLRVQMRGEIKDLHQRLRTTTVYVTHDQIEAMTMADKIVVMQGGRVEQIGTPLELYDRPVNLFVAGFIGSPAMNFLRGRVSEGAFRPDGVDGAAPVALPMSDRASEGQPVVYGIRPEHLRLSDTGIPVTVQLIEPTGAETMVTARMGGSTLVGAFRERVSARVGDTLHVQPEPALAHLFNGETGMRLLA
jgi:multiple sugar transport system ATP-binding protein